MKKVLIDTNVILDFLFKREPFFNHAEHILELAANSTINASISATTITDIYYLGRKQVGGSAVSAFLFELLQFIDVATVNKTIIIQALQADFADFEDAVQDSCAKNSLCNVIITRNKKDFSQSNIEVLTPEEFIVKLGDY